MGKKPQKQANGKSDGLGRLAKPLSLAVAVAAVGYAFYVSARLPPASQPQPQRTARAEAAARGTPKAAAEPAAPAERVVHQWRHRLVETRMTMEECLEKQRKLTHIPATWPGFHALCVESVSPTEIVVRALVRADDTVQTVRGRTVREVLDALKPLLSSDYGKDDPTIVDSVYEYPPHAWQLFSPVGEHITDGAAQLHAGDLACIYEGGQFIWPGWEIGHVTNIEVPVVDADTKEETWRVVPITTASLRPLVFELSGFLTDEECEYIISCVAACSARLAPAPSDQGPPPPRPDHGPCTALCSVRRCLRRPPAFAPPSAPAAAGMRASGWCPRRSRTWTRPTGRRRTCAPQRRRSWAVAPRRRSSISSTARTT